MPRRATFALGLTLTLAVCWGSCDIRAQTDDSAQRDTNWDFEYDLFQMLLEEQGLKVTSWADAIERPQDSVVVVVGDTRRMTREAKNKLSDFAVRGGRVLVAVDSAFSAAGIGVVRSTVAHVPSGPFRYQGYSDCVVLPPQSSSPMLDGIQQAVFNRTSWFTPARGRLSWETLMQLPKSSQPYESSSKPVLSLGSHASGGNVVVCGDGSLFTNGMIWHGDNALLSIRIADLLSGGSSARTNGSASSRKTKLAFLVNSVVQTSVRDRLNPNPEPNLDSSLPPMPEPTVARALRLANAITQEVQASNVINEGLARQPRRLSAARYFWFLLSILAVVFFLLMVWLILRNGVFKNRFLLPVKMRAGYQLRDSEAGRDGDYRGPAGFLAREFCFELTGSKNSVDWREFWSRLQSNKKRKINNRDFDALTEVIDVASRGCHGTVNMYDFQAFGGKIQELRARYISQPTPMS